LELFDLSNRLGPGCVDMLRWVLLVAEEEHSSLLVLIAFGVAEDLTGNLLQFAERHSLLREQA
jgi:hypothetical protein